MGQEYVRQNGGISTPSIGYYTSEIIPLGVVQRKAWSVVEHKDFKRNPHQF